MLRIEIYGIPKGKGRARTVKLKTGQTVTYTPENTADWEGLVRHQLLQHRQDPLIDEPVSVRMIFFLPKPKSAKKAEVFCSKKPDLDNLEKCIMDCMEGLILTNDSRVVEKSAGKRYAIDRGPGVEVVIAPVLREEGQV